MSVHLPIIIVKEARKLMSVGLILPKDGKSIITPSQNMLIGIYYLSSEVANGKMNNLCNLNEALKAYQLGAVSLRSVVGISTKAYLEKTFLKKELSSQLLVMRFLHYLTMLILLMGQNK